MTNKPDITALGIELNNGTISASALLARHLEAIQLHQSALNCFVSVDGAAAKRDAEASDIRLHAGTPLSPIDGIPIALKDNIHVTGMTTQNGTRAGFSFNIEAVVTSKLRAAGAIILGKLNMDECALGATTDNPHHNRTHNPWRIGHIPGGSSGGAGAAVASRMAMAALGTDTLGSVRLPAAYCGVVGLKPTQGLISTEGVVPLCPSLDHVGPLCLSVRDAALLLNILVAEAPEDWTGDPNPINDLSGLRFGILDQIENMELTDGVAGGFDQVKSELRDLGAKIIPITMPELDLNKLRRAAFLIIESEGASALAEPLSRSPGSFSNALKAMFAYGRNAPETKIDDARHYLETIKMAISQVFAEVDFILSPTAPQTAFAFDGPIPNNQADLTALANISGYPAITLPSGLDASGLPLAIQLMASSYRESELLGTAMVLEGLWGTISPPLTTRT